MDLIGNGQIIKKTLQNGKLDIYPEKTDFVNISYKESLPNGKVTDEITNSQIQIGDYEIVQGLDYALTSMQIGEIAEVQIDSKLAYGNLGYKNIKEPDKSIPPNSNLHYVVELLDCQSENKSDITSFDVRKFLANRRRERANFWYYRNEFDIAIHLYKRALIFLTIDENQNLFNDEELNELLNDKIIIHNNLAMALIKINKYNEALLSLDFVLKYQPNNTKALFRMAKIFNINGNTKDAIAILQRASIFDSDNKFILRDLSRLLLKNMQEQQYNEENANYEDKYIQNFDNDFNRKTNKCMSNQMKLIKYFLVTSAVFGVMGVVTYKCSKHLLK